jgi:hypothetical protein
MSGISGADPDGSGCGRVAVVAYRLSIYSYSLTAWRA